MVKIKLLLQFGMWVSTPIFEYLLKKRFDIFLHIKNHQPWTLNKIYIVAIIKTNTPKEMDSSSNFDKLLMGVCTNEQLVSYIELVTW